MTSIPAANFVKAANELGSVIAHTPLQFNANLSKKYHCNVYLKREDLQTVRSYKIRGAYHMISTLPQNKTQQGIVCASAGNHAQGVAFSCNALKVKGVVFMPSITPNQKIRQTKMFGESYVEVILTGDTYDDCATAAKKYAKDNRMAFVPPFDHKKIIEGQGTVAVEIFNDLPEIDYILIPNGGGGLCAGISQYAQQISPSTQTIGIEPEGAPSMTEAFKVGEPVTLETINSFVDGAAVKRVGDLTYKLCKESLSRLITIPEGKICTTILELYNRDAIVVEPAGAMSISALDLVKEEIKGKTVVCIVSGSNNDIDRMQEIKERSLQYEGLKHYFLINFAQRPGALKEFVNNILGPDDDITRFEYVQKTNKDKGPALIGIELKKKEDYARLIRQLQKSQIKFTELNKDNTLFEYLV